MFVVHSYVQCSDIILWNQGIVFIWTKWCMHYTNVFRELCNTECLVNENSYPLPLSSPKNIILIYYYTPFELVDVLFCSTSKLQDLILPTFGLDTQSHPLTLRMTRACNEMRANNMFLSRYSKLNRRALLLIHQLRNVSTTPYLLTFVFMFILPWRGMSITQNAHALSMPVFP